MARRLNTASFTVMVKAQGANYRFPPDLEISAFRIIQELVNNSLKHSNPTEINIKINNTNQLVNMVVSDNGNGFNLKSVDYLTRGSGLLSIKNRVGLFNGNFDIKSAPEKGTTVNVTLRTA
jgi:signal transduction histidine kinase